MAAEASYTGNRPLPLETFKAGQLIDYLDTQLQAENALSNNNLPGLIHAIDPQRGGNKSDGIGPFSPGTDRIQEIDIRATYANQQVLARKNRQDSRPRTLHGVVEYSDRYTAATGLNSLRGLSRLAIAMLGIAVESSSASAVMSFVDQDRAPITVDDKPFDALMTLRSYDQLTQSNKTDQPAGRSSALATSLLELAEFGPRSTSDACIVVSDFVMGAQRNTRGELVDFDWQQPLESLADTLGDRLYTVRLTTPAQTALPFAREYVRDGKALRVDTGDYLDMAENYQRLGQAKADRISTALARLRHVELTSVDRAPIVTVGDFIFGKPRDS